MCTLEKEVTYLRTALNSANARVDEITRQATARCTELDSRASSAELNVAAAQAENARFREEGERITNENRLLKRAVGIQAGKISALEAKASEQEANLAAAADAVRRLETENYALKHHLRQAEAALQGRFGHGGGGGFGFGDGVA